jgi:PAS domain S-box-containing protein
MPRKLTYEDLKESVKELKKEVAKHKRSEEAARASEKKWLSVVDNAPNIIMIVDRKGIIRFINHSVPGLEVETTLGTSHYDYAPHEYHKLMKESIRKVFKTGKPANYEIPGVGPNDSTSWYMTQLWPIDGHRQVVSVTIMPSDITQQKEAQEALRVSEEKLRTFMDSMSDFCVVTDKDENLIYVNKSMAEKLGYSREEMIGMHISRIISEESMVNFIPEVKELVQKGKLTIEATWLTKEGEKIHGEINANAIYDSDGNYTGSRGVFRNITERKRAEEALRESEEKYKLLIESSDAAITFFDESGTYLFLNHAAAKWLGGKPEDYIGKSVHDTFPKRWANKFVKRYRKIIKSGVGETIEEKVNPLNRWTSANLQPVRNQDGKIIGVQVVRYDITERKQAEEALREREAALETRTHELQEVNNALRVLMKRMADDKKELEENVSSNIKGLVAPYTEKLKKSGLGAKQMAYLNILESSLNDITSPFARKFSSKYSRLTPRELQIASLIKDGKTTKQIAELLNSSARTIESQRGSIRMKIGGKNKKTNLRSLLLSMQDD